MQNISIIFAVFASLNLIAAVFLVGQLHLMLVYIELGYKYFSYKQDFNP